MRVLFFLALVCCAAQCQSMNCDLREYKPVDGLTAQVAAGRLQGRGGGERGNELRADFTIHDGQPVVHRLALRSGQRNRRTIAPALTPPFDVTTGRRRMSEQQLKPLRDLKLRLTPELLDHEKWNAFWDAPLDVPGRPNTNMDLPRKPEEVRRAQATYNVTGCTVKTEGTRLEVTFPGLSMGIFAGQLRFTVYKGANLLRQEANAKADEPSVGYQSHAGL